MRRIPEEVVDQYTIGVGTRANEMYLHYDDCLPSTGNWKTNMDVSWIRVGVLPPGSQSTAGVTFGATPALVVVLPTTR